MYTKKYAFCIISNVCYISYGKSETPLPRSRGKIKENMEMY